MIHSLEFSHLVEYDAGLVGISLDIQIALFENAVKISAKIDTGSTNCVFARQYGEQIGLSIEDGELVRIGTPMGFFQPIDISLL